jgi:predicted lysophospholipase L1 biosynthesis ABC-type transport system permease subunit
MTDPHEANDALLRRVSWAIRLVVACVIAGAVLVLLVTASRLAQS